MEGFQGDSSVVKQGGRGGSTARITVCFESLLEHQRRPEVSTAVRCTVRRGELTNGRDFAISSGLVTAKPWLEATLPGWSSNQWRGQDRLAKGQRCLRIAAWKNSQ